MSLILKNMALPLWVGLFCLLVGMVLPWQIPVNQLASDPDRASLALALGCIGGIVAFAAMLRQLSGKEVLN